MKVVLVATTLTVAMLDITSTGVLHNSLVMVDTTPVAIDEGVGPFLRSEIRGPR